MWVKPKGTSGLHVLWRVVRENEFFMLLEHKGALVPLVSSFLSAALSTQPLRFRIVLKTEQSHAVAVSEDADEIEGHWNWIMKHLMPKLSMDKADRDDMFKYLLDKLKSRCKELGQEELQRQSKLKSFYQKFPHLKSEKLVAHRHCTLWREGSLLGTHRHGSLWLSENHLCFTSAMMREKLSIGFRSIVAIKKEASHFGVLENSIVVKTKEEEYFFSMFTNRDETYDLLITLWNRAMESLMNSGAVAATENASPTSQSRRQSFMEPIHEDERERIVARAKHKNITSMFRLPITEYPLIEYTCSLFWVDIVTEEQTYATGIVYLSKNLLYFRSTKGPELRLILPLTYIDGISKDNPFRSAITVISHGDSRWGCLEEPTYQQQQYLFSFVGHSRVKEKINAIVARWLDCLGERETQDQREIEKMREKVEELTTSTNSSSGEEIRYGIKAEQRQQQGEGEEGTKEEERGGQRASETRLEKEKQSGPPTVRLRLRLTKLWTEYLQKYGAGLCMLRTPRLQALIRCGIPPEIRAKMWQISSGSAYYALCHLGLYQQLLEDNKGKESNATEEIERDLHRSLPDHPFFQTKEGITALRNVLTAYSWFNPQIGYCQGMNIVVATLLDWMNEEEVFYLLVVLCEHLIPQYYNKAMLGSLVDQQIIEELVKMYLPDCNAHLTKLKIPLSLVTMPWLLCLFIGNLPEECSLRVLDSFFLEGPNILFRVALAILKMSEEAIMKAEGGDAVVPMLKDITNCPDCDELFDELVFGEFAELPTAKIEELRNANRYQVIKQMEDHGKQNQLRLLRDKTLFTSAELEDIYQLFQQHHMMVETPVLLNNAATGEAIPASFQESSLAVNSEGFSHLFRDILYWWKDRRDLLELTFHFLDKGEKGYIHFSEFIIGLSPLLKGDLRAQLLFCLQLHDFKKDGTINVSNLYNALDALKRIYDSRHSPEERPHSPSASSHSVPSVDLDAFVLLLFEKAKAKSSLESLKFEDLTEMLLDTPLLKEYLCIEDEEDAEEEGEETEEAEEAEEELSPSSFSFL
ncbi:GTPase activating protein (GAP) [Balamuthia mandrillaris]